MFRLSQRTIQIQGKLLVTEISSTLRKIDLPRIDFSSAKQMANMAVSAIRRQQLGYGIFLGKKVDAQK